MKQDKEHAPLVDKGNTGKDYGTSNDPALTPRGWAAADSDLEAGEKEQEQESQAARLRNDEWVALHDKLQSFKGVAAIEDMPEAHSALYANVPHAGVAVKIISISNLDMTQGTFDAQVNINVAWRGKKEDKPRLQFYNALVGIETVESEVKSGSAGWDWFYRELLQGTFRQKYILHSFPFDHQQLRIDVRFKTKCKLVHLPWSAGGEACSCDPRCLMDEYVLTNFHVEHQYMPSYKFAELAGYDPEASLVFTVGRKSLYWVANYGLTSSLIGFVMGCTYAIPVTMVGERLGVATTLVLTMLATKFLMMERLPSVPYFTLLDYHMLVSQSFLCILTAQIGLTGLLGHHRTERMEHFLLPVVFAAWILYHLVAMGMVWKLSNGFRYTRMHKTEAQVTNK